MQSDAALSTHQVVEDEEVVPSLHDLCCQGFEGQRLVCPQASGYQVQLQQHHMLGCGVYGRVLAQPACSSSSRDCCRLVPSRVH